jgi:hypothetical protein
MAEPMLLDHGSLLSDTIDDIHGATNTLSGPMFDDLPHDVQLIARALKELTHKVYRDLTPTLFMIPSEPLLIRTCVNNIV